MKRYQVIFAPEARDDLFALYDWIATTASPATALSYIERFETYCFGSRRPPSGARAVMIYGQACASRDLSAA